MAAAASVVAMQALLPTSEKDTRPNTEAERLPFLSEAHDGTDQWANLRPVTSYVSCGSWPMRIWAVCVQSIQCSKSTCRAGPCRVLILVWAYLRNVQEHSIKTGTSVLGTRHTVLSVLEFGSAHRSFICYLPLVI